MSTGDKIALVAAIIAGLSMIGSFVGFVLARLEKKQASAEKAAAASEARNARHFSEEAVNRANELQQNLIDVQTRIANQGSDNAAWERRAQAEQIKVRADLYQGRPVFVVHNGSDGPIDELVVSSITEKAYIQRVSGRDYEPSKTLQVDLLARGEKSTAFQLVKADAGQSVIEQIQIDFVDSRHIPWTCVGNKGPYNP
jgi:hypothetical protein